MKETKQSLSELWALLKNKEQKLGLNKLSLIERDIFQTILYFQRNDLSIKLDVVLKNCDYPRATFFRSLKKLRINKFIEISKDIEDARKSIIKISPQYYN